MLRARWQGYEIDSSEAAYEVSVPQPEQMGTLVRNFLTSGYFTRSYYLLFEEPFIRLRDFIKEKGNLDDKPTAQALEYLEEQIAKFDPESHRASRIGVKAIESILNYVGSHRQELLDAQVFRFELTPEQEEMYAGYDYEFTPGEEVNEGDFYSEQEIPLDGVVLYLGCSFVTADQLSPEERKKAHRIARRVGKEMDSFEGPIFSDSWSDLMLRGLERSMPVSLRVRLNPDATFTIAGRWMEDGQFMFSYYDSLLEKAAKKAGVEIGAYPL
ncbi:MAG: hypothetical protein NUW24_15660 [Anaerolineae bacterium]|jgi:hypothetical protein|nr:hypothetical protein [Anaerolineae bacterium]MDH7472967.1 hypothetical protein [Anaerolineae bacterium]